jgi:hypothetical protein
MISIKRTLALCAGLFMLVFCFNTPARAQSTSDDLSPKTQQYIDNLNEVQQAQKADQPVASETAASSGPSFWTFVFYGFLSGAAWAFWRWLKRLKNGD